MLDVVVMEVRQLAHIAIPRRTQLPARVEFAEQRIGNRAALFLAREGSVDLRQDTLGASPVLLVRTAEERSVVPEEEA